MRLFIAICLDEHKDYFLNLQSGLGPDLAKTKAFHLTLKFIGETDDYKEIAERLKQVRFRPFSLKLKGIGFFPNERVRRVVWVGVEDNPELMKLQEQVEDAVGRTNGLPFRPHVTLARARQQAGEINVAAKEKTVEVRDFRLIRSTLTPEGPIYHDLAEFIPFEE